MLHAKRDIVGGFDTFSYNMLVLGTEMMLRQRIPDVVGADQYCR
jgi:hypothetical protein